MTISSYDSAAFSCQCTAITCRQLAHVLKQDPQALPPKACGAQSVLDNIRQRENVPAARLKNLESALKSCAEACKERMNACEAKDLDKLRNWSTLSQERLARVQQEMGYLLPAPGVG